MAKMSEEEIRDFNEDLDDLREALSTLEFGYADELYEKLARRILYKALDIHEDPEGRDEFVKQTYYMTFENGDCLETVNGTIFKAYGIRTAKELAQKYAKKYGSNILVLEWETKICVRRMSWLSQ